MPKVAGVVVAIRMSRQRIVSPPASGIASLRIVATGVAIGAVIGAGSVGIVAVSSGAPQLPAVAVGSGVRSESQGMRAAFEPAAERCAAVIVS